MLLITAVFALVPVNLQTISTSTESQGLYATLGQLYTLGSDLSTE